MSLLRDELSDARLSAYIDGELSTEERSRILQAIRTDTVLAERICELRWMRELVRYSYHASDKQKQGTAAPSKPVSHRVMTIPNSIAAGILAVLCLGSGWFARALFDRTPEVVAIADAQSFQAERTDRPMTARHDVLLHIDSSNPSRLAAVLDAADKIVRENSGPGDRVVILANNGGINLLRADMSPYAGRISSLLMAHQNIELVACRNGVERLEAQTGLKLALLPGVTVGRSAVDEIVMRLREGWLYVKV